MKRKTVITIIIAAASIWSISNGFQVDEPDASRPGIAQRLQNRPVRNKGERPAQAAFQEKIEAKKEGIRGRLPQPVRPSKPVMGERPTRPVQNRPRPTRPGIADQSTIKEQIMSQQEDTSEQVMPQQEGIAQLAISNTGKKGKKVKSVAKGTGSKFFGFNITFEKADGTKEPVTVTRKDEEEISVPQPINFINVSLEAIEEGDAKGEAVDLDPDFTKILNLFCDLGAKTNKTVHLDIQIKGEKEADIQSKHEKIVKEKKTIVKAEIALYLDGHKGLTYDLAHKLSKEFDKHKGTFMNQDLQIIIADLKELEENRITLEKQRANLEENKNLTPMEKFNQAQALQMQAQALQEDYQEITNDHLNLSPYFEARTKNVTTKQDKKTTKKEAKQAKKEDKKEAKQAKKDKKKK